MLLGDYTSGSGAVFERLKEICWSKKYLFALGETIELKEFKKIVPAALITSEFIRPFNTSDLVDSINHYFTVGEMEKNMQEILIIDDDPTFLWTIKGCLSDTYSVKVASSGMEGISLLAKEKPDLILLDYEMPVVNGDTVLQMLNGSTETKDIPVIFLTGKDDKATVIMKEALAEIDSAGDGPEAIENAKNNRYDIIFMDQKMPGMGGFETMKEIKADPECGKNHETPIILLTANATPGMYEEAIRDGFNDYLSKPIAIPELIRILRKYLPKDKIEEISEEKKAAASADQEKDSSSDSNAELFEILRTECGLDAKTAAKNMGNEELYLSVLSDFAELGANNADEIEAFKNTKDIENYTIKVHALKSSARTIGAKLLSSEAKDLEELGDMARKGNSESFARIEMSTEKLLSDYRSLSESINDVLRINGIGNNTEGNTKTTLPEISESELKDAYSVILEMAEAFDIDGINAVVENLEGYRLSDADKEKVKAIKHSVKEVNYEGIKKAIR